MPSRSSLDTPEFRLLAACSYMDPHRWTEQRDMVLSGIAGLQDTEAFLALVKRHRVPALACTVLHRATQETQIDTTSLHRRLLPAGRNARLRSLVLHAEWLRICEAFGAAGITIDALKGTSLSERLYFDPGMRHTRDIDVMVSPEDVSKAAALLRDLGYSVEAGAGVSRVVKWHLGCHLPKKNIRVELHWRFERMPVSHLEKKWAGYLETAKAGGAAAARRFDLLYCCLHGASHAWSRLKWLGDVRALAGRLRADDWPELLQMGCELRMEATLAQTFLLLDSIYAFPVPSPALQLVETHQRRATALATTAAEWLSSPEEALAEESWSSRVQAERQRWQHHYRHRLHERTAYWTALAFLSEGDMQWLRLPRWLAPLYPAIRPFSLLGRAMYHVAFRRV